MSNPSIIPPVQIADYTDAWGRPEDGHETIHVRDEFVDNCELKHMVTQWQPTPEQLEMLNTGASIFLSVQGLPDARHPPVLLAVAHPPVNDEDTSDDEP